MSSRYDEAFVINGVEVTARQLAEARQFMAHKGAFNIDFIPPFGELTEHEQTMAVLDARNYLRALAAILPEIRRG